MSTLSRGEEGSGSGEGFIHKRSHHCSSPLFSHSVCDRQEPERVLTSTSLDLIFTPRMFLFMSLEQLTRGEMYVEDSPLQSYKCFLGKNIFLKNTSASSQQK